MRVGFIGLGNMGAAQATEIARAGFELAVYDAWPATLAAFKRDAMRATSPAEVARNANIIGICVRDDQQVREVIQGPGGVMETITKGALVLVHSTVSPETVAALAEVVARRGADLIDSALTRTRFAISEGPFVLSKTGGASVAHISNRLPNR